MFALNAIPYVPGRARGVLRFGPAAAAPGCVVALRQQELGALGGRPAGVILVDAAPFSHPALRLLSQAIPAVLAGQSQLAGLADGDEILLDGRSGLLLSPVPQAPADVAEPPACDAGKPVFTRDGCAVELRASIGSAAGACDAVTQGAAAVGLVRTEYLFPGNGTRPDTEFLSVAFEEICRSAAPLPVTFRLVDVAGDKIPPWLAGVPGVAGALGLQGARLYAAGPVRRVYLAELEALGRLAGRYRFAVLLPYVASLPELEALVAEIRQHLPPAVPVGVMLETPAAALAAGDLLEAADFAALGCNDLMQCLFAADRDLPALRAWLDPHAPVLYRFLRGVIDQAGRAAGALQVCGLLSQWPGILPLLVGLGYRNFSVDPVMIPWLAQGVRQTDTADAARLADAACAARRPDELRRLLAAAGLPVAGTGP